MFAAAVVDKDLMVRLTMATESIASTMKELVGIQTDKHEKAVEDYLKEIRGLLDKKSSD